MNPIYGFDDSKHLIEHEEEEQEIKAIIPDSETESSEAPVVELFGAYDGESGADSDDDSELGALDNKAKWELIYSMIANYFSFAFVTTFIVWLEMAYEYCSAYVESMWSTKGLTLHFVGIGRPSTIEKSDIKLFENINTDNTLMTMETELSSTDSIQNLKDIIKETYNIPGSNDVLIMLGHDFITNANAKLGEVGISNNSLLTLAVCNMSKCKLCPEPVIDIVGNDFNDPVVSVNALFADDSDSESSEEDIRARFDYEDSSDEESDISELDHVVLADEDDDDESSSANGFAIATMFGMYDEHDDEDYDISDEVLAENEFVCVQNGTEAEEEEEEKVEEVW